MNSPRTAPHTKPKGIAPPLRTATVCTPFAGRFSRWKFGERVRVVSTDGDMVCIERLQWITATGKPVSREGGLPMLNQCAGVSRSKLDFE